VVVVLAVLFAVVVAFPLPMVVIGAFGFTRREMNFTSDFLKMEVPVHIVLQPENALAALIRPENNIAPRAPLTVRKKAETAILVTPELLHYFLLFRDDPLTHQLLQERCPMVRVAGSCIRFFSDVECMCLMLGKHAQKKSNGKGKKRSFHGPASYITCGL